MVEVTEMLNFAEFLHENAIAVERYGENEITFQMEDVDKVFIGEGENEVFLDKYLAENVLSIPHEIQYGDDNWVTIQF